MHREICNVGGDIHPTDVDQVIQVEGGTLLFYEINYAHSF
jgi:hypothetical protein